MDMTFIGLVIALCLKILCGESAMMPFTYAGKIFLQKNDSGQKNSYDKPTGVMTLRDLQKTTLRYDDIGDLRGFGSPLEIKGTKESVKKPCSVLVVSSNQGSSMQSLLRKYRYDANGVLIPSSVKYYIKTQGFGSAPFLVPLTGKAFSPLGGFVRYYKEVPPIPPSL